jgi:hypothetical protein
LRDVNSRIKKLVFRLVSSHAVIISAFRDVQKNAWRSADFAARRRQQCGHARGTAHTFFSVKFHRFFRHLLRFQ